MHALKFHIPKIITLILLLVILLIALLNLLDKNKEFYYKFLSYQENNKTTLNLISNKEESLEKENNSYLPLQSFFTAWQKYLLENLDISKVVSEWSTLASKLGLCITRKEITEKKNYIHNHDSISVTQILMSVDGSAEKILHWMGQLEEQYPLFRMDTIKICSNENNCELELIATLPDFKI